jgi:hypothetical protein
MADKSETAALAGAAEIFPPDNLTPAEIARQQIEKSKMNDELGFNELNASRMRSPGRTAVDHTADARRHERCQAGQDTDGRGEAVY